MRRRRRRRKKFSALDSKFCFTSSIYVWHTYLHKCTVLVTTAEFFANKTSLFFFSALARVFLSNNRRKKKGSLSLVVFVSTSFQNQSFLLFHDFTEYYY
mgnify:CR=1 FL=1